MRRAPSEDDNGWLVADTTFSGSEIGPVRAVEESVLALLTESSARSDIYAWYSLIGTAGTAFGMMTCGWTAYHLMNSLEWDLVDAYCSVFIGYAAMGALKLSISLNTKQRSRDHQARITLTSSCASHGGHPADRRRAPGFYCTADAPRWLEVSPNASVMSTPWYLLSSHQPSSQR